MPFMLMPSKRQRFIFPLLQALATSLAIIFAMLYECANAASPGKVGNDIKTSGLRHENRLDEGRPLIVAMSQDEINELDKNEAASRISGSPWPGVLDHILQSPLPGGELSPGKAIIHINYPSIGEKRIDRDIRGWVNGVADAFQSHLDLGEINSDSANMNLEEAINSLDEGPAPEKPTLELWGSYKVERPSNAAVSITFELWNYTGSRHGNLDIITLNYSLLTGQRLNFVDIFENPDLALHLMSAWSRKELEQRLGSARRTQMLISGTDPLVENFSNLALTPDGIRINFQPYQVAPWDVGIQTVLMPLKELLPSSPLLALWGK